MAKSLLGERAGLSAKCQHLNRQKNRIVTALTPGVLVNSEDEED